MAERALPHPAPAYSHPSARHHPYAPRAPAQAHPHHGHPHPHAHAHAPRRPSPRAPPSPARSRRDENSPPLSAKGDADNYWEDVPPPPASLKAILDSFRRSGEGDRDLLLSILGAKKSEEERLTALIHTRLTILQARLNLTAMQAQAQAAHAQAAPEPRQERTPSLTSQSSNGEVPPGYYYPVLRERERERDPRPDPRDPRDPRDARDPRDPRDPRELQLREREHLRETRELRDDRERYWDREREMRLRGGYERAAPGTGAGERLPPITDERRFSSRRSESAGAGAAEGEEREMKEREAAPRERERDAQRDSREPREPREPRAGLDMLLEGVREAERDAA